MTRQTVALETSDPPIACSLTADQYRQRVDDAGQIARDALRRREPLVDGVRLTFGARSGVHKRLEDFVAGESECCPFLEMRLSESGAELILEVSGPADAAPIIAELFS